MEDKELIAKLSHFKKIRPRKDWVVLTRQSVIGAEFELCKPVLQKGRFWGMVERLTGYVEGAIQAKPAFVIPVLALMVAGGAS